MNEKSLLFQYPFVPKSMVVNGHRMSYIDEGAGDRVVVMGDRETLRSWAPKLSQGRAESDE